MATIQHPIRVALIVLAATLVLSACAREDDDTLNEGTNPSGGEIVIEVRITDDGIALPDEIPSGPLLFEVTNNGTVTHGFAIEGVEEQLELRLDELATLRTELAPGSYVAYSQVEDDRANGLEAEFTVVERADDDDPADAGVGPSEEQDPIDDGGL